VTTLQSIDETSIRALLRDAWATQLGAADFTDDDPFVVAGGDSLKAVKVMKQVGRAAGRKLSVRLLFDHQSINELSVAICDELGGDEAGPPPAAPATAGPLSAASIQTPDDWRGTARTPLDPDTVFNGFVAANVVFSLDRLGLLDLLAAGPVPWASIEARHGRAGLELVRVAVSLGYLTRRDGEAVLTPMGHQMHRMRGYFTWSVGGYHDVFRNAGAIIAGHESFGDTVVRDEAMVATGSGQNGARLMAHILDEAVEGLGFAHLADLGSGDGSRLRQLLSRRPAASATGYDISAPATALARQGFAKEGLSGRAAAVEANVLDLIDGRYRDSRAADVDAVVSVFLLHDLLADPGRRPRVLPGLRESFPQARTFLLADTMLRPGPEEPEHLPVFAAGYELAHALMGVPLHTTDTYEELFAAAGLRPKRVLPFGTPHSWLYVLDAD
jgi:phenylpyruvate C(3)-methyltransferase